MAWTSWKGFNFRDTLAYVTDGTSEQFVGDGTTGIAPMYPTTNTIGGDSVTYGHTANGTIDGTRNRSNAIDVRLAGIHFCLNSQATRNKFRVDLPSTGTYEIRLAFGEQGNDTRNWWRILDDTTTKETVDNTGALTSAANWVDATAVNRASSATWASSNATVTHTFATTTFFLEYGGGNSSTSTAVGTSLAHLAIQKIETGPTITDVDTDETITATQTNVAITGTGFGASQGGSYVAITQDSGALSVQQTVDSWGASGTSIQIDVVQGGLRYGVATELKVTVE